MTISQILLGLGPLLSGIALSAAAWIAYCNLVRPTRRRQAVLIDTVYHHASFAIKQLEGHDEVIETVRKKIECDKSYHPYVVDHTDADLSYSQVIEVLRYVNTEEERPILYYYYSQADLHEIIKSFSSGLVKSFPVERKLRLWEEFREQWNKTLCYAKSVEAILKERRT